MINFPDATRDPKLVPELRAALMDFAEHGGIWERMELQQALTRIMGITNIGDGHMYGPQGFSAEELEQNMKLAELKGSKNIDWYRRNMPGMQCIWVSAELVDIVEAAMESIPDDLIFDWSMVPAPTGIVVLERPIYGIEAMEIDSDILGDEGIRIDAFMWGKTNLLPDDMQDDGSEAVECVSLGLFRMVHPEQTDPFAKSWYRGLPGGVQWAPLGRTDWPVGHEMANLPIPSITERQRQSMEEDRRLAAALWAIMQQRNVVETTMVKPIRQAARRLVRAGHEPSPVCVVHLRSTEHSYRPSGDTGGRTYKHRWMVRPHYRMQAHGPGRSLRKLILVPPHIKGPDGAPVLHTERVWAVDR